MSKVPLPNPQHNKESLEQIYQDFEEYSNYPDFLGVKKKKNRVLQVHFVSYENTKILCFVFLIKKF